MNDLDSFCNDSIPGGLIINMRCDGCCLILYPLGMCYHDISQSTLKIFPGPDVVIENPLVDRMTTPGVKLLIVGLSHELS